MNKKWKTLLIIFLSTVCLTGCSTDLKRKKSSDTNKLVEYNVYSDLSLILNQNNSLIISDKEISKQKLNEDEYNTAVANVDNGLKFKKGKIETTVSYKILINHTPMMKIIKII